MNLRDMEVRIGRELFGVPDLFGEELIPNYGIYVYPALAVANKLREMGWLVIVKWTPDGFPFLGPEDVRPPPEFFQPFAVELQWMGKFQDPPRGLRVIERPYALGHDLPEAICRVAIQAMDLLLNRHGLVAADLIEWAESAMVTKEIAPLIGIGQPCHKCGKPMEDGYISFALCRECLKQVGW